MQVGGIVAEYNPFHLGHQFLLQKAKANTDAVVVAMSGNFTQRAEPAILSDRYRAKMALLGGADLVFQLPLPYAIASAKNFAFGGISLLEQTKAVHKLYFGSESANIANLEKAVEALGQKETDSLLLENLKKGLSYPNARAKAVKALFGKEVSSALENPNDILAIAYLTALHDLHSAMKPVAVERQGAGHDAPRQQNGYASASFLREQIKAQKDVSAFLPQSAQEILQEAIDHQFAPTDYQKLDLTILAFLRTATKETFAFVPDVAEGIENCILSAAKTATSLEELFMLAKSKRYTHSRIRRIVLSAFLGVQKDMAKEKVPYLRVLGATKNGIELLKEIEKKAEIPILKRAADAKILEGRAKEIYNLELKSTDIFNLTLPKIRPMGTEMTDSAVFMQDF